jgi:hypothetical protein
MADVRVEARSASGWNIVGGRPNPITIREKYDGFTKKYYGFTTTWSIKDYVSQALAQLVNFHGRAGQGQRLSATEAVLSDQRTQLGMPI